MKDFLDGKKTNICGYLIAIQAIITCVVPLLQGQADLMATVSALWAHADQIGAGLGLVALRAGVAKAAQ